MDWCLHDLLDWIFISERINMGSLIKKQTKVFITSYYNILLARDQNSKSCLQHALKNLWKFRMGFKILFRVFIEKTTAGGCDPTFGIAQPQLDLVIYSRFTL